MDLISIIVPIYKVEVYLDKCVRSIAAQTYENLEIILVDDGSPDNCPAMCDAWAEKDRRVRVIHKENGGLSDARNAGLAIATGEYISFIDSDDYIAPEFIAQLLAALQRTGADIAECATAYVDETGCILQHRNTTPVSEMDKMEALRRLVLEDGIYQTVWNKLYRRHVAMSVLFAVGKYNEDEFWTYQVIDRIEKLAVVQEPLYNYLQRSSSIIGVGYNIRRLDGLEARFQRMEYLQKYEELAVLTRQQFVFDCLWNLQSTVRLGVSTERQQAADSIRTYLENTPRVPIQAMTSGLKYRIWYFLFRMMPLTTVRIRNMLKIGM